MLKEMFVFSVCFEQSKFLLYIRDVRPSLREQRRYFFMVYVRVGIHPYSMPPWMTTQDTTRSHSTSSNPHVHKSWRSDAPIILPGWECHNGGSRSKPTVHWCRPKTGGCGLLAKHHTKEPNRLSQRCAIATVRARTEHIKETT